MIKITNISLKNFLSVGAVTLGLNLEKNGLTLVLGANTDTNGGLTRNGAGKTTVLQAISFAIFGKPLSKIKIPNLINNINNKQMLVTLDFERDGKKYRIERGKKPDVMKFYINGQEMKDEDNDAQGENRHTQAEIEKLIGMSHNMFKHIVALNTYTEPFLRMGAANQREIIEELLGVTQISQRAEVLKKLINETKEAIRDQQAAIKATTEANSRIEIAIKQAEASAAHWSRQHATTIASLKEEIEAMQNIDYEAELKSFDELEAWMANEREIRVIRDQAAREIEHLKRELHVLNQEYARYDRVANEDISRTISRLETDRERKTRELKMIETRVSGFKAEMVSLQSQIDNPDSQICVCCNQKLVGTDHLETVLTNLREQHQGLAERLVDNEDDAQHTTKEIEAIDAEMASLLSDHETKITEARAKADAVLAKSEEPTMRLKAQEALLADQTKKLHDLPKMPETLFSSKDEVYKAKQMFDQLVRELEIESEKTNPNTSQVETLKATLQAVDYEPLNDLDSLLKHQDFLLKLLTSKDSFIRKKIIDQNLRYLNDRLNSYLDKLGLPHEVTFQSDLSVEITLLGRDFDFEQLSRGEMNRVIMATSWSFRDVWESLNESFNLMFVDEMLDQGTDAQGVEAALGILKAMARDRGKNVFLISHRDDLTARIDRILLVRKENGFTRFEEDALV